MENDDASPIIILQKAKQLSGLVAYINAHRLVTRAIWCLLIRARPGRAGRQSETRRESSSELANTNNSIASARCKCKEQKPRKRKTENKEQKENETKTK